MKKKTNQIVDIKDMALYTGLSLITKGFSVTPLKLQKILYYEQSWFMVFFGRENTLFQDCPQAWECGPIYPPIFKEYRDKGFDIHDNLQDSVFAEGDALDAFHDIYLKLNLSEEQIRNIESVITLYGGKSQNQLIFLSHSEEPWTEKREGLKPFERSTAELSLDTMYQYYKKRHEKVTSKKAQSNYSIR